MSGDVYVKSIYFISGKSEVDDSFEVYHINRLKKSEMLSRSLQKEYLFFDLVPTKFIVPNQTR